MEKYSGKKNIAVFISGRGSNLKSLIRNSNQKKSLFKVLLVISNNPDAKGLKYATKSKIINYGIKFKDKSNFETYSLQLLKKYKIDMLCLAGFMKILSSSFIKKFSNPILNIHPSLLPRYKGLNTHERAINNGDKYAGASIHKVTQKLDSGKIILQKKVKILKKDNARSLKKKVLKIEHEIYPKGVNKFLTNF
ncbi:phosphoribosylglycinamide formyltransferase [Pelagibacterales bacterium SAG-MED23]|nr:phosphoribosylglycinamide formyltransferase [Pelagibacterales bacterium SAG-MED23]